MATKPVTMTEFRPTIWVNTDGLYEADLYINGERFVAADAQLDRALSLLQEKVQGYFDREDEDEYRKRQSECVLIVVDTHGLPYMETT